MAVDPVRERTEGRARTGFVNLRAFDQGVVETLGARVESLPDGQQHYFLHIDREDTDDLPESSHFLRDSVEPRPGLPGVPVSFSYPEDAFNKYTIPLILVNRDDITPAMERWHPGLHQYRAPGRSAQQVKYKQPDSDTVHEGWDRMEYREQAVPYDLSYTINVIARNRGAAGAKNHAQRVADFVSRVYQPYCRVLVTDSVGDLRSYEAFQEAYSPIDEVAGVADRVIGFAISIRIVGELDLTDPQTRKTVTRAATLRRI